MGNKTYAIRSQISADDVIKIRKQLNLTQQRFADFLNVSKKTVEYWERKTEPITGPVVTLLKVLEEKPSLIEYYEQLDIVGKLYGQRITFHFSKQDVNRLIKEELHYPVEIKNRVEDILLYQLQKYSYLFR